MTLRLLLSKQFHEIRNFFLKIYYGSFPCGHVENSAKDFTDFCIKGLIKNNNTVCYSFTGVMEIKDIDRLLRFVYKSLFCLQENKDWKPQVSSQVLLLLSGDDERCPGPSLTDCTKAIELKIVHQNIRGIFENFGSFCATLANLKPIDIGHR